MGNYPKKLILELDLTNEAFHTDDELIDRWAVRKLVVLGADQVLDGDRGRQFLDGHGNVLGFWALE